METVYSINMDYTWADFALGLPYSITFLLILTVHEFGHYFTAMYHRVKATLPYYIPLPPYEMFLGTLGAVIRIKSAIYSRKINFDIGIAGPLAGFVVAIAALFYGFLTLPDAGYVERIHAAQFQQAGAGSLDIVMGNNILFWFFENFVGDPSRVPSHHELYHFPILFAAFWSLVFTSINLLPIGQLDGGHVLYGLIGSKKTSHRSDGDIRAVCRLLHPGNGDAWSTDEHPWILHRSTLCRYRTYNSVVVLLFESMRISQAKTAIVAVGIVAVQYVSLLIFPGITGYSGWLLFAAIIGRIMPVAHPPTQIEEPLSLGRKILGWIALIIFVICWTPRPIETII
ncbi:MAG: site-2 protease family protein [Bacteroidota bacterium]